jgi:hypothetical protein
LSGYEAAKNMENMKEKGQVGAGGVFIKHGVKIVSFLHFIKALM